MPWYLRALAGAFLLGTALAKGLDGRWFLAYWIACCAGAYFFVALADWELRGEEGSSTL